MSPDVVTLGEALLRFSVPTGARLESASRFDVGVAGAELNVAVALARMGRRSGWIGSLPENLLGKRVYRELRRSGVETSGIVWMVGARMGTYYIEHARSPRPTEVLYDRADSAAARLDPASVDWTAVEGATVAHLTGITPAISPNGRAMADRLVDVARGSGVHLVFDVNYRSKLWTPDEASASLAPVCEAADTLIVGWEDARDLFGVNGPANLAVEELRSRFEPQNLIVTHGRHGSAYAVGSDVGECGAFEVDVVDGIGAGDAFAAGVIGGVLDGDVPAGIETGTAMAALVLGIEGDLFQFGPDDVAALTEDHRRSVSR